MKRMIDYDLDLKNLNDLENKIFNEILSKDNFQMDDLELSLIPSTKDSKKLIFRCELDLIDVKGNSDVVSDEIVDSQPIKLISHGFNQWNEEWENGYINDQNQQIADANSIHSKNYSRCLPNTTYYFKGSEIRALWYDANMNFIDSVGGITDTTKVAPSNACYFKLSMYNYGTTYNHDICINLSNADLNGEYKPYTQDERDLTLPILRSAGSAQDDCSKVKVGVADLGTMDWIYNTSYGFICTLRVSNMKYNAQGDYITLGNITCGIYTTAAYADVTNNQTDMAIAIGTEQYPFIVISNSSYTDATAFKAAMSGVMLNYELAIPTDQVAVELPKDIKIEKGGTIEIVYNDDNIPSDFVFEGEFV